jgi:hypothetical protein
MSSTCHHKAQSTHTQNFYHSDPRPIVSGGNAPLTQQKLTQTMAQTDASPRPVLSLVSSATSTGDVIPSTREDTPLTIGRGSEW